MVAKLKLYQTIIFTVLFIGYGIYSYNRKSVTYTIPKLVEEGGITKENAGTIASAQNLAYMIGKIICGILSDKISPNLLFSSGLFLSGIFTLMFSQANNFYLLVLFWFLNGFVQGAGWPALAKFIQRWFAKEYLGVFWSVLAASSNLSLSISPYLVTNLIFNHGWRFSLLVSGTVCIGFSTLSMLTLINYPENVGLVSFVQAKPLSSKTDKTQHHKSSNFSIKDLLLNPFIWLISLAYMIVFLTKSVVGDWGIFYLKDEMNFDSLKATSFMSTIEVGGFIGSVIIGFLSDLVAVKAEKLRSSYHNPKLALAALCTVLYSIGLYTITSPDLFNKDTPYPIFLTITFLLGACLFAPIQLYGVIATESAPPHLSGTSHAIVAACANLGAIISGYPVLKLASLYSLKYVFILLLGTSSMCVGLMVISRLIATGSTRSKDKTSKKHA